MSAGYLAVDLGAESGRVVLGRFDGGRVSLEEVHRFPNRTVRLPDGLHWDVLRILCEIKDGLAMAAQETHIEGVGVDSWGVDFGLLDGEGALVANPYHHRDTRTVGMMDEAFGLVPREEIYRTTGIQFLPINTLYQLLAMRGSPLLGIAETLLLIPDLINYWLTGERACEYTNATTTQLIELEDGRMVRRASEWIGSPLPPPRSDRLARHRARSAAPRGGRRGRYTVPGLRGRLPRYGLGRRRRAREVDDFAYISSGTWSLVGVETRGPVVTPEAMEVNFTNEGGFGNRTRFLKNVMGLWILQECRRQWAREGHEYSYEELAQPRGRSRHPARWLTPTIPRS